MATLNQLHKGVSEAWEALADGWQRLYRRAAGALTRFTPGRSGGETGDAERQEIAVRSSGWGVLAAEVFDDEDQVVVRLEAPGMEKSDLDLQVLDDYLIVRGEKRLERERTEGRYHVSECAYGTFERVIPLPDDVEGDKARANYRNGVLRVELPKASPGRRKQIRIDVN
jgi:HSP20 family protein